MAHLLRILVSGVPIGLTVVTTVGYVAKVNGVSMRPVFNPIDGVSDYVLLSTWAVKKFQVKRGDIVSLVSPSSPDTFLIKRVVGLEGDILKSRKKGTPYVQVPKGHCWVEGENHHQSMDSNYFGPIPMGLISAKATYIVWPFHRMSKL